LSDACVRQRRGGPAKALYEQLRKAGVSAELHMFADMDDGFNIAAHSESLYFALARPVGRLVERRRLVPAKPPIPAKPSKP